MSIKDRTRKILWGRSGNRCAYCRRVLVEDGTDLSDESVVGDECHMIHQRGLDPSGNQWDVRVCAGEDRDRTGDRRCGCSQPARRVCRIHRPHRHRPEHLWTRRSQPLRLTGSAIEICLMIGSVVLPESPEWRRKRLLEPLKDNLAVSDDSITLWIRRLEAGDPDAAERLWRAIFPTAIPRDLEVICLKAIGKDRRERYGSAREMADDLRSRTAIATSSRSGTSGRASVPAPWSPWPTARTDAAWRRPTATGISGSGTRTPAASCAASKATPRPSGPWHSARMAGSSPRPAAPGGRTTRSRGGRARSRSGTCRPAPRSAPSRATTAP